MTEMRHGLHVLFDEETIAACVGRMGREITQHYRMMDLSALTTGDPAAKDLVVVIPLNGGFVFGADLVRQIDRSLEVEFVEISSCGDRESPGTVQLKKDVTGSLEDKHVLVVDDIADTRATAAFLRDHLAEMNPATIAFAMLLVREDRRRHDVDIKFVGKKMPAGAFAIGYGLDDKGKCRNLPFIGTRQPPPP